MTDGVVCPRCAPRELVAFKFLSGVVRGCGQCEGLLLDRRVAVELFGGQVCTFEAPALDGPRCGACEQRMTRLSFGPAAPLHACAEHGVWVSTGSRAQLPPGIVDRLRRRMGVARLLAPLRKFFAPLPDGIWPAPGEAHEVRARKGEVSCGAGCGGDSGHGGHSSCGGDGGCGGGCGGCGGCGG